MTALKKILIDNLINLEGGYVNDKNDSGGETNFGITKAVAQVYGYTGLMKDMKKEKAVDIYEKLYWQPLKLDLIQIIDWKIAEELFDTGVNCGVSTSAKFLQRTLNALNNRQKLYPDLVVDGVIGASTINALKLYMAARENYGGAKILLRALNCLQGAYYIDIAERREKDETFLFGWLDKRVVL